ncbi:MAG: Acetyltransferase family protein [Candidatus Moranbacteria bacterium GW2011_GWE1_49_15]|nr:MAG: Acetyltransferase family protein [Candidatus Moranbacteria bacterium GW2011_GWE1_49_15]
MELIRATIEDIETLLEMERTAVDLKVYAAYSDKKEVEKWVNSDVVYLIENEGLLVGNISYEIKDADSAYISGLIIRKEFQRQGLAKRAMALLLEELKKFKRLSLVVHPDNHAVKLYESFGFEKDSRVENYFGDGEPRLVMVKNI